MFGMQDNFNLTRGSMEEKNTFPNPPNQSQYSDDERAFRKRYVNR